MKTRLFPRGTGRLATAVALFALGHAIALGSVHTSTVDALALSPDEGRVLWALFYAASAAFLVIGGLWGDFGGHRRNLVIGPALAAGALFLFLFLPRGDVGEAAPLFVLVLSAFALGRSLFSVSSNTLVAHLYEQDRCRVPLVGAFTMLHVCVNIAVLLLAPFAATSMEWYLSDALGLGRDEARRVAFLLGMQPVLCALIIAAVGRRVFAAAEIAARGRSREKEATAFDDGGRRLRPIALALVLAAYIVGTFAYGRLMSGAGSLAASAFPDAAVLTDWINGAVVVFLAPVAVIVYGRMRRGDGLVPLAAIAAVGAGLMAIGAAIVAVTADTGPATQTGFTPPWLEDSPSPAWPIVVQIAASIGEILFFAPLLALIAATASRRRRGLLLGAALSAFPASWLFALASTEIFSIEPESAANAILGLVCALVAAALLATAESTCRERS